MVNKVLFSIIRKKDGLTDGLLNNLVRYVMYCNEDRILRCNLLSIGMFSFR